MKNEKIRANEKGSDAKITYKKSRPVVSEMLRLVLLLMKTKQDSP